MSLPIAIMNETLSMAPFSLSPKEYLHIKALILSKNKLK
jgi:hypothetical protein